MKKELIGFLICMLLIAVAVLPVVPGAVNNVGNTLKEQQITVEEGSTSQGDDVDWWPMYKHDPENLGYSTSTGPNTNNILWTFTAEGGNLMYASTAVVDGKAYAGSRDTGDNSTGGVFYCLDAETGNKIWQYITPHGMFATPAVADGKVYVCTAEHYDGSDNGDIHCLDADDGSVIWEKLDLEYSYFVASPVVTNGKLYFVGIGEAFQGNDRIYCLDANTGDIIWTNDNVYTFGNLAVSNGRLFVPGNKQAGGCPKLYCFNSENGEEFWTWNNSDMERDYAGGAPTVVDGKVYVGTVGWGYYVEEELVYFPGHIYCLDVEDGSVLWESEVEDSFENAASPTVAYGNVYIGAGGLLTGGDLGGYFYCLDANDGSLVWQRSELFSSILLVGGINTPIVADDKVYVSVFVNCFYSMIYCFDAFNGETIWEFKKNAFGLIPVFHNTAIADGQLYVASGTLFGNEGMVYCFADISPYAPYVPTINGPSNGQPGIEYEYTITATDPNADDIFIHINWDDGSIEEWIGPYSSGEEVTVSHTWSEKGKYEIKARAKDTDGLRSAIGTLPVSMPVSHPSSNQQNNQNIQQNINFQIIQQIINSQPNSQQPSNPLSVQMV